MANFTPGTDLLDLSLIDANATEARDQAFAWAGTTPAANAVWYSVSGPGLILAGDINGDASPEFEILVKGLQSLQEGSFGL